MAEVHLDQRIRPSDEDIGESAASLDFSLLDLIDAESPGRAVKRGGVSAEQGPPSPDKVRQSGKKRVEEHAENGRHGDAVQSFTKRNGIRYTDVIVIGELCFDLIS